MLGGLFQVRETDEFISNDDLDFDKTSSIPRSCTVDKNVHSRRKWWQWLWERKK